MINITVLTVNTVQKRTLTTPGPNYEPSMSCRNQIQQGFKGTWNLCKSKQMIAIVDTIASQQM
jgi:hypothetical protein